MNRKGGYKIIDLKGNDLTDATFTIDGIYEALEGNYNKAILLTGIVINDVEYDDVFTTPKVESSNYVLDAYGYTLTIDSDDLVTTGEVTTLMENIVDKDGHKRFENYAITETSIAGVTYDYTKASLSGLHLMYVCCITIDASTTIPDSTDFVTFNIPDWMESKLVNFFGDFYVDIKPFPMYEEASFINNQDFAVRNRDSKLYLRNLGSFTTTNETKIRIQFDLIIDNE